MSKNNLIKSTLSLSVLMCLNAHALDYQSTNETLEFQYSARNVYIQDSGKFACEVDFDALIAENQKVAGMHFGQDSIVTIEMIRHKGIIGEEITKNNPYLSKETIFGFLKQDGNKVSFNRQTFFALDNESDAKCIVTNVSIQGIPRARLSPNPDKQSGLGYFPSAELEKGPLTDEMIVLNVLSLPFTMQMFENLDPEYAKLIPLDVSANDFRLSQSGNDRGYALYLREVLSGETGLKGSFKNGLSQNFLELKTADRINEFLLDTLVIPAIEFGITTESFNSYTFADKLRKHILADLEQALSA